MQVTPAALVSWTLAAVVLVAFTEVAQAQIEADPAPARAPTGGSIVFLAAPELPPTVRAALIDALEAQLTGTGTALHWEAMTSVGTDLRAAIDQGKPAASAHSAAGVFWLDASGANDWLLYLMDASGERILVRRMEDAANAPGASIEAIAVIVRESAAALSAGRPIAMDPLPPPATDVTPALPPAIEPAATPEPLIVASPTPARAATLPTQDDMPGMLRFALGYVGSPLSKDVPWQSGLDPQVAVVSRSGLYAGVAYTLLPTLTVRGEGFSLGLDRRPIRLLLGAGITLHRLLRLDADATAIVDVVTRTTLSAPTSGTPNDADTRVIFGAGLNARINWTPQPSTDVFLSVGVQGFLNRFDYAIERNLVPVTLLSPWPVSPVAGVGVAFRP